MAKGAVLNHGIHVVDFWWDDAVTTLGTSATDLIVQTDGTTEQTDYRVPFKCQIIEVGANFVIENDGDQIRYSVQRDSGDGTQSEVISNGFGGSAVSYVELVSTGAAETMYHRYTGIPQDSSVAAATGFVVAETTCEAGDLLTFNVVGVATGDDLDAGQGYIVLARMDETSTGATAVAKS